jgi:hypothetical protein
MGFVGAQARRRALVPRNAHATVVACTAGGSLQALCRALIRSYLI